MLISNYLTLNFATDSNSQVEANHEIHNTKTVIDRFLKRLIMLSLGTFTVEIIPSYFYEKITEKCEFG